MGHSRTGLFSGHSHAPLVKKKLWHFLKFWKRPKKGPVLYFSIIKRFWLRMIHASHTNLAKNKKKNVKKKFAQTFFFARKLLNNSFSWNATVLKLRTVVRVTPRMFVSNFEQRTLNGFFLVNFFLKMAIFKKSGLTRAFFGPNFFFQNHLSNGWVICTEPWTNCKCIYTPNFIFITVLKKDFSVRDYAPDQFRAPISSFILI